MTNPRIDFQSNCLDVINVLESIRKRQIECKYVHISSAAVYGNPLELPISESSLPNPLSPYGWHKLMLENLCKEYTSVYGIQTIVVRPFSVYGPGLKKQLFWDLYQKIKTNKDGMIDLWGTGRESRDFIYIDDLIRALHILTEKASFNSEIYNLASGIETSISEVIDVFVESYDRSLIYSFNGNVREGNPVNWKADISKIESIGFKTENSIQKGISKLTNWLKCI